MTNTLSSALANGQRTAPNEDGVLLLPLGSVVEG